MYDTNIIIIIFIIVVLFVVVCVFIGNRIISGGTNGKTIMKVDKGKRCFSKWTNLNYTFPFYISDFMETHLISKTIMNPITVYSCKQIPSIANTSHTVYEDTHFSMKIGDDENDLKMVGQIVIDKENSAIKKSDNQVEGGLLSISKLKKLFKQDPFLNIWTISFNRAEKEKIIPIVAVTNDSLKLFHITEGGKEIDIDENNIHFLEHDQFMKYCKGPGTLSVVTKAMLGEAWKSKAPRSML